MQRRTAIPQIITALVLLAATLGLHSSGAASASSPAAALFAQLCGNVGGANVSLPAYPDQPNPTGNGAVVNIEEARDLDDLLAGRIATPPPGSVISLAAGVYSEASWSNRGGSGIGFAGTSEHPITWYSRSQYGVEVTAPASYRAMQLRNSDAHHRFIGFHLRDGRELFLSEANGTEFFHGRVSGSTAGGAWKWRGVEGGPTADGMRFMYNVVSTANGGSNFGRLEGLYIGDGQNPQILTTRQTNFQISHNCIVDAPGGAIDIKANSTNGLISNNLIDSTDHWSGGINALPGWSLLPSSVRAIDPNVRSVNNTITVRAHPLSGDGNAGSGIRVSGTWSSENDTVQNSSNAGFFVFAQADLELSVTGFESTNNPNGAARRGGNGGIALQSSNNTIEQQGNLILSEAAPTVDATTTSTSGPTTTTAAPTTTTAAPTTTTAAPTTTTAGQETATTTQAPFAATSSTTTAAPSSGLSGIERAATTPTTEGTTVSTVVPTETVGTAYDEAPRPNTGPPTTSTAPDPQTVNGDADDTSGAGAPVVGGPTSPPNTFPASADLAPPTDPEADAEPPPAIALFDEPAVGDLETVDQSSEPPSADERESSPAATESGADPEAIEQGSDRGGARETTGVAMVEIDDASSNDGFPFDIQTLLALVGLAGTAVAIQRKRLHSTAGDGPHGPTLLP